ncbi:unnamed protein product [Timema podura]|uniref:Uncharacterized protein n=1 Tax=Timema podura TaxID=61482 RepID=A0ABN7NEG1_TIMPD|nr:unnamed protein product [Timema podura]
MVTGSSGSIGCEVLVDLKTSWLDDQNKNWTLRPQPFNKLNKTSLSTKRPGCTASDTGQLWFLVLEGSITRERPPSPPLYRRQIHFIHNTATSCTIFVFRLNNTLQECPGGFQLNSIF